MSWKLGIKPPKIIRQVGRFVERNVRSASRDVSKNLSKAVKLPKTIHNEVVDELSNVGEFFQDKVIESIKNNFEDLADNLVDDVRKLGDKIIDFHLEVIKAIGDGILDIHRDILANIAAEFGAVLVRDLRKHNRRKARRLPRSIVKAMATKTGKNRRYFRKAAKSARYMHISKATPAMQEIFKRVNPKAMAFIDVIVFRDDPVTKRLTQTDLNLWAHEIWHVHQWQKWGTKGFCRRYFSEILKMLSTKSLNVTSEKNDQNNRVEIEANNTADTYFYSSTENRSYGCLSFLKK